MYISWEFVGKIAFELTLFALTVMVVIRVFSERVLPAIYLQIREGITYRRNLQEKRTLLKNTQQRMSEEARQQESALAQLETKIAKWHKAQKTRVKRHQENQNEQLSEILKKKETRQQHLHLQKVQQEVIPKAIANAQTLLEGEFAPQNSRQVFGELLERLAKLTKKPQAKTK